jgi:threonine dehydratase
MFELLPTLVDRWVLCSENDLRTAIADLAMTHKLVVEGAGALPFAALRLLESGGPTAVVISGGNIDAERLADILRT